MFPQWYPGPEGPMVFNNFEVKHSETIMVSDVIQHRLSISQKDPSHAEYANTSDTAESVYANVNADTVRIFFCDNISITTLNIILDVYILKLCASDSMDKHQNFNIVYIKCYL